MSDQIPLGIKITADGKVATDEIKRIGAAFGGVGKSVDDVNRHTGALTASMARMGQVAATAFSFREIAQAADAFSTLNARLSLVSAGAASTALAYQRVVEIAQATRVGIAEVGLVYEKFGRSADQLGLSQQRVADLTLTVSQAMVVSGASAASTQAALLQFGQALSAGALRGEELNSILEQSPRLAQAIADGLNVPIGKLRELGEAGQLTSEKLVDALQNQAGRISAEFARMPVTIGGALTNIRNAWIDTVGSFEKSSGVFGGVAGGLQLVASNMGAVATVGGTLAALMGGRLVNSFYASASGALAAQQASRQLALAQLAEASAAQAAAASVVRAAGAYGAGVVATKALADANVALAAAQTSAAATAPLAAGLRMLGGPIGIVTSLLMVGATAWSMWGDSAKEASDKAREALRAAQEEAARQGLKDTDLVRQKFAAAETKYYENMNDRGARAKWAELGDLLKELETRDKNLAAQMKSSAGSAMQAWESSKLGTKAEEQSRKLAELAQEYNAAMQEAVKLGAAESARAKIVETYQRRRDEIMKSGGGAKAAAEESDFFEQSIRMAKEAEKELAEIRKVRQEAEEEETKSREAALKAGEAYLTQIDARASAMEKEVENYGKTESAIELTTLARLKEVRELAAANGAWPEHLAFLDREIAARERLASAAAQKEVLDANKKAAEDSARTWEKITGDINKNLVDAIFGGGKSAGEMLKDYFKTLILTPMIQGLTAPISNAIGEALGYNTAGAAGAGAVGSAGNLVSTGSGLYQAWQGYTTGTGTGMWGAAGNYLGGYGASGVGAGFAGSANYLTASQAAAQGLTYDAAAGGYLNAQGTIVANAAPSSSAGALGGAATAVGYLAVAYLVLDYLQAKGGGVKTEGDSFATVNDQGVSRGTTWVDGSEWYALGAKPGQMSNPAWDQAGWEAAVRDGIGQYKDIPGDVPENEVIAGMLEPWTDSVRQMLTDLGGSATGLKFGLGYSTDPAGSASDNISAGVADASGNQVYRSTHDVDKGTYGAALTLELQRMMVASIKAADVSPVYKSVVDSIDLMTASAEQLNQVMTDIGNLRSAMEFGSVDPFQAYADSLEAVGQSLTAQLAKQRAAVTAAAAAYNGSTASINALAAATQQRYQMELALAKQLDDLVKSSSSMYAGGRREIEMAGLDSRGKYDYYDAEASRYRDVLATLTTEADIQEYRDKLYQSTMSAFGTLDESQQAVHKTEFLARLDDQEKLVNDRIAAVKDNIKTDNQQLQTDIATAIDKAMADAAAKIAAAASIPVTVNVVSSINLTGGGATAEVGGWSSGG